MSHELTPEGNTFSLTYELERPMRLEIDELDDECIYTVRLRHSPNADGGHDFPIRVKSIEEDSGGNIFMRFVLQQTENSRLWKICDQPCTEDGLILSNDDNSEAGYLIRRYFVSEDELEVPIVPDDIFV